mgnify:CR=1 FL=1
MSERIVLVGAGNMATAIACSLKESGELKTPPVREFTKYSSDQPAIR